ncbi:MAG: cytochrome b6-f complex subunit PetN [Xenococcus sp. (in: cyanobacteria)]|nr:cytochrome b6-f complex subunit PetN [Xenococcaceae cyanobacterium MO_167.B52]
MVLKHQNYGLMYLLIIVKNKLNNMDILTLGWAGTLALFSWSIAMVVWGRNGF